MMTKKTRFSKFKSSQTIGTDEPPGVHHNQVLALQQSIVSVTPCTTLVIAQGSQANTVTCSGQTSCRILVFFTFFPLCSRLGPRISFPRNHMHFMKENFVPSLNNAVPQLPPSATATSISSSVSIANANSFSSPASTDGRRPTAATPRPLLRCRLCHQQYFFNFSINIIFIFNICIFSLNN